MSHSKTAPSAVDSGSPPTMGSVASPLHNGSSIGSILSPQDSTAIRSPVLPVPYLPRNSVSTPALVDISTSAIHHESSEIAAAAAAAAAANGKAHGSVLRQRRRMSADRTRDIDADSIDSDDGAIVHTMSRTSGVLVRDADGASSANASHASLPHRAGKVLMRVGFDRAAIAIAQQITKKNSIRHIKSSNKLTEHSSNAAQPSTSHDSRVDTSHHHESATSNQLFRSHFTDIPTASDISTFSSTRYVGKQLSIDDYGFIDLASEPNPTTNHALSEQHQHQQAQLALKWRSIMDNFSLQAVRRSRRVRHLVVSEGIPHCMRAEVWQYLAGVQDVYQPNEYQRLIDQASDSSALPAATVHLFDVIERDLGRCYPDHVLFVDPNGPGQRELRNILRAYALHNPDVGYCQGMGRLVGLMLITGLAPEAAFWLLTALLSHTLKGYYTPTLFQLRVHAASFGVLLREHDPYLHRHIIEKCQVEPLTFMTNWFLTAYTMALPWHLALRVWDWMILRGPKVLFRVGIGMLSICRRHILSNCPSMTDLLGFLLHIPHDALLGNGSPQDDMALMEAALSIRFTGKHLAHVARRVVERGIVTVTDADSDDPIASQIAKAPRGFLAHLFGV